MANRNDSDIFKVVAGLADQGHHGPAVMALYNQRDAIQDDTAYWQIVAAVWIKSGTTRTAPLFRVLLSSERRNRHKLMKKSDRRVWRKLPAQVKAYRAVAPGERTEDIFSYTLDPKVLDRIYGDSRRRVERVFPKRRVVAYFNRRNEHEIIVL